VVILQVGYWKTANNVNGITFNYRKWKWFELNRHETWNCLPARV